jgi:anthranilate phosphoribosyltransferase
VLLNAAAALLVAGLAPDLDAAAALATDSIDGGKAAATLDRWMEASTRAAEEA